MQGYRIIERRPEETAGRVVRYELTKRAAIMKAMWLARDAILAGKTRQYIVRRIDGGGGNGGGAGE